MAADRWQRVRSLFEAAIDRPPAEREAFLAAETAGDEALRLEVESLLAADARDDAAIDRLPLTGLPLPTPPRRIGPYELGSLIGAGSMGEVYRARDTALNRDVALKVLPPLLAFDPDRVARFRREAQVLAALSHPNIAAIYGFEESGGMTAIALEFVDGPTLADRIARGPLPLEEALEIARQIADALETAHDKGIIHRDLKPANVKLGMGRLVQDRPDNVKVLDFGLAKAWEGAPAAQLSAAPTLTATLDREHTLLGTPAYMSPEQARGRPLDKRADIWSFGCVLYEMLTGRAAFAEETISDTLAHVLERDVDWQALPSSTPGRVRNLLRRCLQKPLGHRLRDIGDARLELEEALTPDVEPPPGVTGSGRRRTFAITAGAAVVALALLGAGYVAGGRDRGASALAFRLLTFRHGAITGARFAVDGRTVVYRATWGGGPAELFLIRPENQQSGSIGLVNAGIYSVSSRGEMAVALGCRLNWGECLGTLAQVPLTGGPPREMVKDVIAADWSPDGSQLAVVAVDDSRFRLEYPLDRILYEAKGWITGTRVSPRADRVAFLDHDQLGDTAGSVAVVDLDGRKTTLSSGWKSLHGLAWSPDGGEVWFSGSRTGKNGSSTLNAVSLGGQERRVFSAPGLLKLHDISRDGQRLLLTRGTTRGNITAATDGAAERDLSWFDYSTVADLSADGKTLLFYEWGEGVGGAPTIFIRRTDGGEAVALGEGRPLALSPNARWVAAVQGADATQLTLLPAGTGDVKRLPRGPVVEYLDWAAWSRDGRRIFFAGRESAAVRRTYVQDVDGGDPRPVTPEGFVGLAMSPDGQTMATVDRYGEFYLCSLDKPTEPRPLAGYKDGDVPLQWSTDGRRLFVREGGNLTLRIFALDLSSGAREFWKELAPRDPAVLIDIGTDPGQVRLTPDGKSYAYTYWTFEGELYVAQGLR
jgi:Tol biopolymer transport system component